MNTEKPCRHCGTPFEGRANKVYCSTTCKQQAFAAASAATVSKPSPSPKARGRALGALDKTAIESLRLKHQHEKDLKLLEMEERERERKHLLEVERLRRQEEKEAKKWQDELARQMAEYKAKHEKEEKQARERNEQKREKKESSGWETLIDALSQGGGIIRSGELILQGIEKFIQQNQAAKSTPEAESKSGSAKAKPS